MFAWARTILMVLATVFVAGLMIGKAMAMIDGLEQGVAGWTSMADWSFWR